MPGIFTGEPRREAAPGAGAAAARRVAAHSAAALGAAALALGLASCLGARAPTGEEFRTRAETLRSALSLADEAAQVLLVGVSGSGRPSAASLELLASMPLGGVLLFGFNIPEEPAALGPFVGELQDAAAGGRLGIALVVALDHEGGSVFRFRGGGITRLPPPAEVGERDRRYALALGKAAGRELRALGVNMALAPVVELLRGGNEAFLGDRSYGRDPARVDATAGAFIEGLQSGGTAAVAKHFPGNAADDPHKGGAVIDADLAVYERDLLPRFAAASRRGVAAIMVSHALLPAIDPERQATFSPLLLGRELKLRLGFQGVVLTDDLYMRAVSREMPLEGAAVEALAAGADFLMLSAGGAARRVRDAIVEAVEAGRLPRSRLDDAARRVLELKLRFDLASDLDPALREARLASYPGLLGEDAREVARARDLGAGAGSR